MEFITQLISNPVRHESDCAIVAVRQKGHAWEPVVTDLDQATDGLITELIEAGDFNAATGKTLLIPRPPGLAARRLLLVGCGKEQPLSQRDFLKLVHNALNSLLNSGARNAALHLGQLPVAEASLPWKLAQMAQLAEQACYRYHHQPAGKTSPKAKSSSLPEQMILALPRRSSRTTADQAVQRGQAVGRGTNLARELANLPPNLCTPTYLAAQARELAQAHEQFKVNVLDEDQLRELGMETLLAVSAGSEQPARLIVLEYAGADRRQKPYVLIGKGITFDSGGISIKPAAAMDEMKFDMSGAASVLGTLSVIGQLQPRLNVVGIVAAAENMPDGKATRPGDVVPSMAGLSVEILNTDAEGRLVLCDALHYAQRFSPEVVIDIATLTGACVIALGKHASGLFSNDSELAADLIEAGQLSGDRAWQLPLWEEYQDQLESNFADLANVGGRAAGSITAACFLSRFCGEQPWAHLDIAGTAWHGGKQKGSTGRPVPLLSQYLLDRAQTR